MKVASWEVGAGEDRETDLIDRSNRQCASGTKFGNLLIADLEAVEVECILGEAGCIDFSCLTVTDGIKKPAPSDCWMRVLSR